MLPTSHQPASRKPMLISMVLLLVLTILGVTRSTISDIALDNAGPASQTLSVDERTYYEFVAPRLDRLVIEVDAVAKMAKGKSRDIIALTISGDRIQQLTDEIEEFGEMNGVPARFGSVHRLIKDGTDTVTYTFGEARSALRRFNFSRMPALITKFDDAADTLHLAQDQMTTLVGSETAGRIY